MKDETKRVKDIDKLLFGFKRGIMPPFSTTWMNMEGIVLSEISLTEEDKYGMLIICGI